MVFQPDVYVDVCKMEVCVYKFFLQMLMFTMQAGFLHKVGMRLAVSLACHGGSVSVSKWSDLNASISLLKKLISDYWS